jgi:long-chain acyl-CoA synthetase
MGSNQSVNRVVYGEFIGPEKEGETRIIRNPKIKDGVLPKEPENGINTLWKAMEFAVKNHPERKFLGTRFVTKSEKEEKPKKNPTDPTQYEIKNTYSDFEWESYKQTFDYMRSFARGLTSLNLCPEITSINDGIFRFLGIWGKNKREWVIADGAAQALGATVVTFYDTLGDDTVEYILEQTKLTTLVVEENKYKMFEKVLKSGKFGNLKNVIFMRSKVHKVKNLNDFDVDEEKIDTVKEFGLNVYQFDDILEAGKDENIQYTPATPETVSTFCYTSGTTGVPKGAMLTNGGIMAEVSSVKYSDAEIRETDVHLSFLPLAHVMERVFMTACIMNNVSVGFSCGDASKLLEDAKILKPTIFLGVPKIYERIYKRIFEIRDGLGWVKRKLIDRAISTKKESYLSTGNLHSRIYDTLVFGKIRDTLGGNVRLMVTGSAPISKDILDVLRVCFSCHILEGYGQTECCAASCITSSFDLIGGTVGGPVAACELKLVDVPHLKYSVNDKDENGNPYPRGEICVRGPILFKGYFNDIENTRKTVDEDGWLHSGDVGALVPGSGLKIIDRVKNIFKLSQGEYVAPEKLEVPLIECRYVNQICVTGESTEDHIIAIMVPKKNEIIEFLKSKEIEANHDNLKQHLNSPILIKEILKELETLGRTNGAKGFEVVKNVYLTLDEFTEENGLLTPTKKVKRNEVKNHYQKEITEMYLSKKK